MKRIRNSRISAIALSCLAAGIASASVQPDRPNLILITADDLGRQLGCYGNELVRTPHLDRIAGEGILFENGYVTQASCSPSRSSLFTGLYPHQNMQLGLSHRGYFMAEDVPLLPNLLREAGYFTAVMGKIHIEPEDRLEWDARYAGVHTTIKASVISRETRSILDKATASEKPFFFMFNLFDPHKIANREENLMYFDQVEGVPADPFSSDEIELFPVFGGVDTDAIRTQVRGYYNAVQRVDFLVGILLEELDERGLADTTMIVFVGDHGPPFSRGKTTVYEFGTAVPFLLKWPGHAPAGRRMKALVSTVDLLPTFLEAAGSLMPDGLSGKSLLPLLEGSGEGWRRFLVTEFNAHAPMEFSPQRAIRNERFKLIHNYLPGRPKPGLGPDGCALEQALVDEKWRDSEAYRAFEVIRSAPEFELYDLVQDPREFNNLSGDPDYTVVLEELQKALVAWQEQTDDWARDAHYLKTITGYHDRWLKYYRQETEILIDAGFSLPWNFGRINFTPFPGKWASGP